ncbi:fibronectin type III domain-containing protein [Paenibacillus amylolyticus]|nr:fibronectin type III domain-containing protein [Paenibacillus amylolyticus]WFR63838.1 fibronectin type III domain-containing protein [Paenibacillus amylolyticus]
MQYRKIMSMLLILVLVAPWLAPAGKVSAGAALIPGNNGLITVKNLDDNSVELSWEDAYSDYSPASDLSYQIYMSTSSDIEDMEDIEGGQSTGYSYGNRISGSTSNDGIISAMVSFLQPDQTYFFNVIVQDSSSTTTYQMKSIKFTTPLGEFNNAIGQNFRRS